MDEVIITRTPTLTREQANELKATLNLQHRAWVISMEGVIANHIEGIMSTETMAGVELRRSSIRSKRQEIKAREDYLAMIFATIEEMTL